MKLRRMHRSERGDMGTGASGGFPLQQLSRLRREIDRMMEQPFGPGSPMALFSGWAPAVDVFEDENAFTVRAELPGMKKEDINVSLEGDTLLISGERKGEEKRESGEMYRTERYVGRFQRSITLPQPVDADKVQARYEDGVLTLTCPKTEDSRRKRISIQTS